MVIAARRGAAPLAMTARRGSRSGSCSRARGGSRARRTLRSSASARGRGVGSALLSAFERTYPTARHVFLCVSSFNARARALYERHGYRLVGELPDYIITGASEYIMCKRLAPR